MAEKETKKEDPRAGRWAEFVEKYKAQNPTKWAIKDKNGEFDKIPDSFK